MKIFTNKCYHVVLRMANRFGKIFHAFLMIVFKKQTMKLKKRFNIRCFDNAKKGIFKHYLVSSFPGGQPLGETKIIKEEVIVRNHRKKQLEIDVCNKIISKFLSIKKYGRRNTLVIKNEKARRNASLFLS